MAYDNNPGRKKEAAPLESAFKELLKAYRLEGKYQENLLINSWPEIVGKTISSRTNGLFVKEKKLYVRISSGPLKKELLLNRSKIMALIEEHVGQGVVDDLVVL